eukprot:TRINITY_DN1330_c0_g1_i1.p1 TRINITY_DN1330_c0_g1~~TRINITY_DN1330_c0_g1_i1.p1  ORF type:complete len:442 (+),score=104.91 TRINITY_DN1330_c0_g1_i1:26-1351(+)
MRLKHIIISIALLIAILFRVIYVPLNDTHILYFKQEFCYHCTAIEPFVNELISLPNIKLRTIDILNDTLIQHYQVAEFLKANAKNIDRIGVPLMFIGDETFIGESEIGSTRFWDSINYYSNGKWPHHRNIDGNKPLDKYLSTFMVPYIKPFLILMFGIGFVIGFNPFYLSSNIESFGSLGLYNFKGKKPHLFFHIHFFSFILILLSISFDFFLTWFLQGFGLIHVIHRSFMYIMCVSIAIFGYFWYNNKININSDLHSIVSTGKPSIVKDFKAAWFVMFQKSNILIHTLIFVPMVAMLTLKRLIIVMFILDVMVSLIPSYFMLTFWVLGYKDTLFDGYEPIFEEIREDIDYPIEKEEEQDVENDENIEEDEQIVIKNYNGHIEENQKETKKVYLYSIPKQDSVYSLFFYNSKKRFIFMTISVGFIIFDVLFALKNFYFIEW